MGGYINRFVFQLPYAPFPTHSALEVSSKGCEYEDLGEAVKVIRFADIPPQNYMDVNGKRVYGTFLFFDPHTASIDERTTYVIRINLSDE
jgi:hypothetical protein